MMSHRAGGNPSRRRLDSWWPKRYRANGHALSFVGIYSVSNSLFNVGVLLAAGLLGYVVRKLGYSIAPLSIGFVLGPILENSLRQSLTIADGSAAEFFNTSIGLSIYAALALTILWGPVIEWLKGRKAGRIEERMNFKRPNISSHLPRSDAYHAMSCAGNPVSQTATHRQVWPRWRAIYRGPTLSYRCCCPFLAVRC